MADWISAKERLPDEYTTVVVCAKDGKLQRITTCNFNKRHFVLAGQRAYWKVTHWMPLPEPPKEVQDG